MTNTKSNNTNALKITALILFVLVALFKTGLVSAAPIGTTYTSTAPDPITNYAVTTRTTVIGQECWYVKDTKQVAMTIEHIKAKYPQIASLWYRDLQEIASVVLGHTTCITTPTVTVEYSKQICSDVTQTTVDPYCWDGIINNWEECDWNDNALFSCNNHCEIVYKTQPARPVAPSITPYTTAPSIIVPTWTPTECTPEMSRWFPETC